MAIKRIALLVAVFGLIIGGWGTGVVAASDHVEMVDCENTKSGEEFEVPREAADRIDEQPHIECFEERKKKKRKLK